AAIQVPVLVRVDMGVAEVRGDRVDGEFMHCYRSLNRRWWSDDDTERGLQFKHLPGLCWWAFSFVGFGDIDPSLPSRFALGKQSYALQAAPCRAILDGQALRQ
ncbi:hypothetical protein, partial [Haliea sp. E17]|uniref:hypothetical protein n=1 Tax=Haliea sp. E17 TaxID=3401576 RepID=UPI003AAF4542